MQGEEMLPWRAVLEGHRSWKDARCRADLCWPLQHSAQSLLRCPFAGRAASRALLSAASFLLQLALPGRVFRGWGCRLHPQTSQHGSLKAQFPCPNLRHLWMLFLASKLPSRLPWGFCGDCITGQLLPLSNPVPCLPCLPSPLFPPLPLLPSLSQVLLQGCSLINHLLIHLHLGVVFPANSTCDKQTT